MNMYPVDWAIVVALLTVMTYAAIRTKKYNKSIADFLAANRCAKRYVIGVAEGIAAVGAISFIAFFQAQYQGGLGYTWWGKLFALPATIIAMSGWVIYRYRQTRALTMAQFLEQRYSRNFRVFSGIVMFVSGVINFGIFPAVGARFFMYFCGFASHPVTLFGFISFDLTIAAIMLVLIGVALFFTFMGGQIAVIVTDFIQGTFFTIILCAIVIFCFIKFPWADTSEILLQRDPGFSMFQPFDSYKIGDFNVWFITINLLMGMYTMKAWQGSQGYNASALNPHEARMGTLLGAFKTNTQYCLVFTIPIFMYVFMHHPKWAAQASAATEILDSVSVPAIKSQVMLPASMSQFLPVGLFGGFCAIMLAAFISTHDTYLHSWGSIFIQDVYIPVKRLKKPLELKKHMRLLKISIFSVAVFIFIFALFYPQKQFIFMLMFLTGTAWTGGAGAAIIGGLYWKRGTTAAAYSAIILGIVIAIVGLICIQTIDNFPITGEWIALISVVACGSVYVLVSLLGKKSIHNMDKLLHRGIYKTEEDQAKPMGKPVNRFYRILGINESFSKSDKFVYIFIFLWSTHECIWAAFWTIYALMYGVTVNGWGVYWRYWFWSSLIMPMAATIWFTIFGLRDMKDMFVRLRTKIRSDDDDGTVIHEANDIVEEDQ